MHKMREPIKIKKKYSFLNFFGPFIGWGEYAWLEKV